jgi:hypothetical protein
MNLKAYPPAKVLYDQLVRYPQEIVMHVMDYVTTTVFAEMFADSPELDLENISFKVFNVFLGNDVSAFITPPYLTGPTVQSGKIH